ncbi:MAG: hypothetical protein ACTSU2_16090 [Promethearchaeota archaeon]
MSYIPKYILKRMLPKDCIEATDDGFLIKMVNVISPITVEEIPDNVIDYLEVKIDDTPVSDEVKKGIKIKNDEGMEVGIENMADAIGVTIPVGGHLTIFVPYKVEKGSKHKFDVLIKADNPINISVEREVQ